MASKINIAKIEPHANSIFMCFPLGGPNLFGVSEVEEGQLDDESEELIASVAVAAARVAVATSRD